MLDGFIGGAPRDHRPRLLSRDVGGGSGGHCRHSRSDGEDAHVLCAQASVGDAEGPWHRSRLAMNAVNENERKDNERKDIEELLPWYAAGTLSRRDAQRVEAAMASDAELARRLTLAREELGQTIHLNETLGAPSVRAMEQLFAKIDAEPARKATSLDIGLRVGEFFALS